ncbi:epithelial-stromal interaction protein 1 [Sphaerodactylus townsendi]|uniref:epithelial-stromal interaction protein 1 n=1 Tax=Sphaerodactylus townsendi TaxID=933632 RepID=UPI0020261205|nr:epithelial-stromal interaction protein 1 [Sphaerodactylus townsendi]
MSSRMSGANAGGRSRWALAAASSPSEGRPFPGQGSGSPGQGEGPPPDPPAQEPPSIYTVIPPNLSRRNQLQRIANKELEELEKWKEQHRPGVICLTPQMLGGAASEADVRRKQQLEHSQSKYQQKLKREQYERVKREAEEAELLKKKAVQREKVRQS